ncbi:MULTISPECIES: MBOAT family protein [unclassified Janthinobacterium]|uniref:MBOAT family O-acyltransferase n=1 Tax=unclassified Janthinobacterium TaxID=2610881 RepID=UPI001E367098|nr:MULTISPECIES: MBOAT family O-acyltransferase [unclassified Janthinobacterium]MCC7641857.1 MBOAT family protein [Janthinobacterium sp. EB271-G4-3-1]MCC7689983.1 MBOAT family protein [Janthinobacterium sp. EB271-G4-3-2]
MLFNSFAFLFGYLPIVLAGYFLLDRLAPAAGTSASWRRLAPATWLALASLFFYAWWDVRYLPLLLASICVNYGAGRMIGARAGAARKRALVVALALNLGLLAYYKYANFFIDNVNAVAASAGAASEPLSGLDIILPIGISFFTFTQIAFLVDCYRGEVREYRFIHYVLFVSYFPHLIAGPVLHHRDMMPQFADPANAHPRAANFAIGLSIFTIGLAKKVLIADNLSPLAIPIFAAGAEPTLIEAWIGVLAYTFQLYFDFSGYSDMAIGLSRLFGVKLPLNFNSPYKAANIADFWRRWHMTLSRFLRDYLYIPLGGSRRGEAMRYRNLMLTMLLGGLWHGAGWTFVIWGGLHGLYLVLQQAWQRVFGAARSRWWPTLLTFLAVMLAWVFFRAPDVATAWDITGALVGANGVSLPRGLASQASSLAQWGMHPAFDGIRWIELAGPGLPVLLAAMLLAFKAPNTQEIFFLYEPAIERIFQPAGRWVFSWRPTSRWSVGLAALFVACIFGMNRVTEFLYFQF